MLRKFSLEKAPPKLQLWISPYQYLFSSAITYQMLMKLYEKLFKITALGCSTLRLQLLLNVKRAHRKACGKGARKQKIPRFSVTQRKIILIGPLNEFWLINAIQLPKN